MMHVLFVVLLYIFAGEASLFHCDFEIPCADFELDDHWSVTTGSLNSQLIHHDHTLKNNSGIYLISKPQNVFMQVKTSDWIQPSFDRAVCFNMWYYISHLQFSADIQLVQGDDENLIRTIWSISRNASLINDWTLIHIRLPSEKVKIIIRLNVSSGAMAFDDLSVDFCDDEAQPVQPQILFSCNGESSCIDDFISLPNYPYQWSIIQAHDAIQEEVQAPPIDLTFGNKSGHYAWLANSNITRPGNVGYLATTTSFHITREISYCLNFHYYAYGQSQMSNLKIYARMLETPNQVQQLWPKEGSEEYQYTYNQWPWGIINLPLGSYSLLFRMDSQSDDISSFALDNINITACDYPPFVLTSSQSLLSFLCHFDHSSECDLENGIPMIRPTFNFTIFNGDTVPNDRLGPTHDHTSNSSFGGFYYWNRQLNLSKDDFAIFSLSKTIERNTDMCIKFAYYVKPLFIDGNETTLILGTNHCVVENLWTQTVTDSQGWQLVIIRLQDHACTEKFYFAVSLQAAIQVSVAFDDIRFEQCNLINRTDSVTSSTTTTLFASTTTLQNSSQWLSSSHGLILCYLVFLVCKDSFRYDILQLFE